MIIMNSASHPPEKSGLPWFIGAGIVGADIGTSVFYSTGILFPMVGYMAPLFILTVCLMMWVFKRTYEEGLALSPYNGGAYVMILRSIGRRASVLAGSLTFVSYLATAAVSALSGAFYLSSLFEGGLSISAIVAISFVPIVIFGLLNSRGIKEPAKIVTAIAGVHFFLLLVMAIWGTVYLIVQGIEWPSWDQMVPEGKLRTGMLLHGFAAAFLGITGFESAAQIVEELRDPILKTVSRLYRAVVVLVSLTAPSISFFCLAVLTHSEIQENQDFLLSGLAEKLGGKPLLIIMVLNATFTLFAAVNTAFVGFIGLATTMAKQGNLPQVLLTRVAHKYPSIQGYPLIALPFMFIAMFMTMIVPGEVAVLGEVYGMAFLGVMVSFSLGVLLMRNRSIRKGVPKEFLSTWVLQLSQRTIPLPPLLSGIILLAAQIILILASPTEAQTMLVELFSLVILTMAFYRWGILENRLEKRQDLRLGIGQFADSSDLPHNLPAYVVCVGGTGARRLVNLAIRFCLSEQNGKPFELVVFHAEEDKDPEGFFFELLQRVLSQQIAPIYEEDFILTAKILPGHLLEGLITLRKSYEFDRLLIGSGKDASAAQRLEEEIRKDLELSVVNLIKPIDGEESASLNWNPFKGPS